MSGTFNDLHVPPTLVSFAVAPGKASEAVSQELKQAGNTLMLFGMPKDETGMPNLDVFKLHADFLYQEVKKGNIAAMKAVGHGGVAVTAAEMAFGNKLGWTSRRGLCLCRSILGTSMGRSLWKLRRNWQKSTQSSRTREFSAPSAER